ncbi:hypothetical protein BDV96DRAFT_670328 [Lophiotrema nucula]|uniref:Uncharacterized protein n=1 Tax=Lophiotrema nucula TaxID=690887 RepID=A0A6A5YP49_9PLEO|nr:hypothetical protein BDV96DRAFT_670328 [Lophiotrema nucula]
MAANNASNTASTPALVPEPVINGEVNIEPNRLRTNPHNQIASSLTPNDSYEVVDHNDEPEEDYDWDEDGAPEYDLYRTRFGSIGHTNGNQQPYLQPAGRSGGLGGHRAAANPVQFPHSNSSLPQNLASPSSRNTSFLGPRSREASSAITHIDAHPPRDSIDSQLVLPELSIFPRFPQSNQAAMMSNAALAPNLKLFRTYLDADGVVRVNGKVIGGLPEDMSRDIEAKLSELVRRGSRVQWSLGLDLRMCIESTLLVCIILASSSPSWHIPRFVRKPNGRTHEVITWDFDASRNRWIPTFRSGTNDTASVPQVPAPTHQHPCGHLVPGNSGRLDEVPTYQGPQSIAPIHEPRRTRIPSSPPRPVKRQREFSSPLVGSSSDPPSEVSSTDPRIPSDIRRTPGGPDPAYPQSIARSRIVGEEIRNFNEHYGIVRVGGRIVCVLPENLVNYNDAHRPGHRKELIMEFLSTFFTEANGF